MNNKIIALILAISAGFLSYAHTAPDPVVWGQNVQAVAYADLDISAHLDQVMTPYYLPSDVYNFLDRAADHVALSFFEKLSIATTIVPFLFLAFIVGYCSYMDWRDSKKKPLPSNKGFGV